MLDAAAVRERIEAALRAEHGEVTAREVAFHMTDWLADLDAFHGLCANPSSRSPADIERLLIGFLYHVPEHVAAAATLLLDYPIRDIFGVGAAAPKS